MGVEWAPCRLCKNFMSQHEIYCEQVKDAILKRSGAVILNSSIDHAAIIAQEMFNNAKESVRLLTHKLDPDCYARTSVQNSITSFLASPDHRLQILVESGLWDPENRYDWNKHPLLKHFISSSGTDYSQQLEIRRVPAEVSQRYTFNFMLLDHYGYRYEAHRDRPNAVAAFLPPGQEAKIANMEHIFSDLWAASQNIALA